MNGSVPPNSAPLLDRGYRFRFLLRLCINFAAGVVVLYAILYFGLSRPLSEDYAGVFHALRNLATLLRPIIATSILAYVLIVCGATAALCVYGLHKVAGPLYRMERVLEGFRSGEAARAVSFRHGDQIEPLAAAFNGWIGTFRQDRQRWLAALDEAERLTLQDEETRRTRMEAALREMDADLSRYR